MPVEVKFSMRVKGIGGSFCPRCGYWSILCFIFRINGDVPIWKPNGCRFVVCDECLEGTLKDWDAGTTP